MSSRASLWFGAQIEEPICPSTPPSTDSPVQPKPVQTIPIQIQPDMEQQVYERYFQQVTRRDFHQSGLLLQYARERQTTPHMLWLSFMTHIQKCHLDNTLANLIEYLSVTARQQDGKFANYVYVNNSAASNHGHGTVNNVNKNDFGNNSGMINNHGFDNSASNHHSFDVVNNGTANNQQGFDNHTGGSNHQGYEFLNNSGGSNHHCFDVPNMGMNYLFGNANIVVTQNTNLVNANSITAHQNVNLSDNFNSSHEETKVVYKPFVRPPPYTHADFLKVKREAEKVFEKKLEEEERKKAEEEKKKEVLRNIHDMLK